MLIESRCLDQCARGGHGGMMMRGEYTSVTEILKVVPGLLPAPHGWGKLQNADPPTYFYLSDFVEMDITSAPDPCRFTARITQLHQTSTSPNGKFGFNVATCDGKMAHTVEWEESWAAFYAKLLRGVAKLDTEANGPLPELEAAIDNVMDKIIPRLLGVLESDGRYLKPYPRRSMGG